MSRRRRIAALALLVLLAVTAGCTGGILGPAPLSDEQLTKDVDTVQYDWAADPGARGAFIDVRTDEYRSVYVVTNATVEDHELEVYSTNAFAQERPVPIETLKFRYENGTVITVNSGPGHESFTVSQSRERATISVPADGQVGFIAPKNGKAIGVPVYLQHNRTAGPVYEVLLPPETDAAIPLLSNRQPGGSTLDERDGRVLVRWEQVTTDGISVRYYLDRDLLIFGVLFAVLATIGVVGGLYYLRQLRAIQSKRQDVALDLEK